MIHEYDLKALTLCKDISKMSDFEQTKLGAAITLKRKVLSIGCNGERTNPLQARYNQYRGFNGYEFLAKQHAEIAALSKLPWWVFENDIRLDKSTIYIYREHKNTHTYACAKPCAACLEAIKSYNIGRIVYTVKNGINEIKVN